MEFEPPSQRNAMLQVLSHREPALLITGRTISAFGDGIANIAITLLVLSITNSNVLDLSIVAAARTIPFLLLLLFGGVTADRMSRRTILLASDLVRGVAVAVLVVLVATGTIQFWHILVFAFVFGAFDAVFFPAMTALTPEIVPGDLLNAWNALRPLTNQVVGSVIGPAVGGLLVAVSTSLALGIDAATFFISALAIFMMRPTRAAGNPSGASMIAQIVEGFRFARRTTWLWTTLVVAGITNAVLFTPVYALAPRFLRHDLHATPVTIGLAVAAGGITGAITTLIVGSRPIPRWRVRFMWISWIITAVILGMLGFATSVAFAAVILALGSPGIVYGNVVWESLMQAEVPHELLGRVSSVDWMMSLGLAPVGLVVAGVVIQAVGMRTFLLVATAICLVPSVWAATSAKVNAVDAGRGAR